jgi:hypothetical protein
VISGSKVTSEVPKRSNVAIKYLGFQFALAREDITTIGLREIIWDIHSGQEGVLALRRRSQAFWPPMDVSGVLNSDI